MIKKLGGLLHVVDKNSVSVPNTTRRNVITWRHNVVSFWGLVAKTVAAESILTHTRIQYDLKKRSASPQALFFGKLDWNAPMHPHTPLPTKSANERAKLP